MTTPEFVVIDIFKKTDIDKLKSNDMSCCVNIHDTNEIETVFELMKTDYNIEGIWTYGHSCVSEFLINYTSLLSLVLASECPKIEEALSKNNSLVVLHMLPEATVHNMDSFLNMLLKHPSIIDITLNNLPPKAELSPQLLNLLNRLSIKKNTRLSVNNLLWIPNIKNYIKN